MLPLTTEQERLWTEWKFNNDTTAYNVVIQLKLIGAVDIPKLKTAIIASIDYFDGLRTYFGQVDSKPHQIILDTYDPAFEQIEYVELLKETVSHNDAAIGFIVSKSNQKIDIESALPTKFYIVKADKDLYYLSVVAPHIVADGVSSARLLEYISFYYNNKISGAPFDERQINTSAYKHYVNETNSLSSCSSSKNYWIKSLKNIPLECNFAVSAEASKNNDGKRIYFDISHAECKKLKSFARQKKTTLFTVLAAAYSTLLHRYHDYDEFVIGYPVSVRPKELKNYFGFFVNTLPLKISTMGNPSFEEMILRINNQRKEDKKYQKYPLSHIVRDLRASGVQIGNNFLNTALVPANFSISGLQLEGIVSEYVECDVSEVSTDLSLLFDSTNSGLVFAWEYKISLFDERSLQEFTDSFKLILEGMVSDSAQNIDSVSIASKDRYPDAEIINSYEKSLLVHDLFDAQAQKNPDAMVARYEDKEISYNKLNERSKQVANFLIEKDIVAGDRVALSMNASFERLAVLLAILRVGAAYIPIDIDAPSARVEFILQDCNAKLIIKDEIVHQLSQYASECPVVRCRRDSLAYIIYTSGTTGQPKGVGITHENMLSRFVWFDKNYEINAGDHVLQFFSLFFDPSVYETLWTLTTGATLVLTSKAQRRDPVYLLGLMNKYNIILANFVPSALSAILPFVGKTDCPKLKYITCGGEALTADLKNQTLKHFSGVKLVNHYGPTETSILCLSHVCSSEDLSVPVGKPIANTRVYILNKAMQLQPEGVVGEIYVAGPGVGMGYINNTFLTDRCFVDDPFCPGCKAYKTGDLGRLLVNGNIEYAGRIDEQVKVNGYRIELEEVEQAISQTKMVNSVAVIVKTAGLSIKLIGYCELRPSADISVIKSSLHNILPTYMIPHFMFAINEIPLTINGKVDKKTLREMPILDVSTVSAPPQSNVEKKIAGIWGDILKMDANNIDRNDKFFEIGGDSLELVSVSTRIESELGTSLPPHLLFEQQTIANIAEYIKKESHSCGLDLSTMNKQLLKRREAQLQRQKRGV